MHLSREAKAYKELVSMAAAHYRTNGACVYPTQDVTLVMTWHRGKKVGDLDKRLGVLLDALQGTIYESDAQIVQLWARRCDEHVQVKKGHVWVQVTAY